MAVAESASRAVAEKNDAVRRAIDLEAKLEALKKESKAALDQAKADAQELRTQAAEHEGKLDNRLLALIDVLAGRSSDHELVAPFVLSSTTCS